MSSQTFRWYEPRGAARDERTAAGGPAPVGGIVRYRQEGAGQPDEQIRRLQEPAQHLQSLPDAEAHDQGKLWRGYHGLSPLIYILNPCAFKDVIRLETQYWTLVEIPKQEKLETVPAFVLRACSIMEKSQKSGEGVKTSAKLAEEAAERRERMERLESKPP